MSQLTRTKGRIRHTRFFTVKWKFLSRTRQVQGSSRNAGVRHSFQQLAPLSRAATPVLPCPEKRNDDVINASSILCVIRRASRTRWLLALHPGPGSARRCRLFENEKSRPFSRSSLSAASSSRCSASVPYELARFPRSRTPPGWQSIRERFTGSLGNNGEPWRNWKSNCEILIPKRIDCGGYLLF